MDRAAKEVERRKRILDHANATENVAKTCRYFGIARTSFYRWREEYSKHGVDGLVPKRTGPRFSAEASAPLLALQNVLDPSHRSDSLG
jgi:transposase-like protein